MVSAAVDSRTLFRLVQFFDRVAVCVVTVAQHITPAGNCGSTCIANKHKTATRAASCFATLCWSVPIVIVVVGCLAHEALANPVTLNGICPPIIKDKVLAVKERYTIGAFMLLNVPLYATIELIDFGHGFSIGRGLMLQQIVQKDAGSLTTNASGAK